MKTVSNEISIVSYSLPWFVARDEGFFESEGLNVEFVRAERTQGSGSTDPNKKDPILGHVAFDQGKVSLYRA